MDIDKLYTYFKECEDISTDSRVLKKNSLFFALKGDNFDGNEYALEALDKGAKYAIIDSQISDNPKFIKVKNVLKTLQSLSALHRTKLTNTTIIAITGSNGKTTSKELINSVLSFGNKSNSTKGNLNNHIGVPLTLLGIKETSEFAIVEMGANHIKEISFLTNLVKPDIGYITNFGKAHLEGFGGVEGVIKGKSELYAYLQEHHKIAFIDPKDLIQVEKTKHLKTICFPEYLKFIGADPFVKIVSENGEIDSNLIGAYNYTNILAAITIGIHFKLKDTEIKKAIENYIPTNNRSQIIEKESNHIILDAYNANPSSMHVALDNFSKLKKASKVVILGDMFELGKQSAAEHQAIVNIADAFCFSQTLYVGEHFCKASTKNKQFKNFEALKAYITNNPLIQESILIKGSRGMQLERLLEFIN